MPLEQIVDLTVVRHGFVTGVAFVLHERHDRRGRGDARPRRCDASRMPSSRRSPNGGAGHSVPAMTTLRTADPELPARGRDRRDDVRRRRARTPLAAEASGFESVWVMDHFWQLPALGGPDEPILEAYTLLGALRGAHRAGAARHARHRRHVPQSRAARQDRHDARRHLEGPRHPRHRRRVVRARARRPRLRLPRHGRAHSTASRKRCRSAARCSARSSRRSQGRYYRIERGTERAASDAARAGRRS